MVLAAVLMLTLQTPADNDGGLFYSYVNDRRWESVVRAADLDKSPRWPPSADNPPLAPRAAIRSARAVALVSQARPLRLTARSSNRSAR